MYFFSPILSPLLIFYLHLFFALSFFLSLSLSLPGALGLQITIKTNLKVVNFLDLTLDLNSGQHSPFRKPNDIAVYIHRSSNHLPSILRNIPASTSRRITGTSSDETAFNQAGPLHNVALKASGCSEEIHFLSECKAGKRTADGQKWKRNVVWFNPPYSHDVKTLIGKWFLGVVSKHFPPGSKLHTIFNRHTVKVSYSCMQNDAQIIKSINHCVLNSDSRPPPPPPPPAEEERLCNCHKTTALLTGINPLRITP